MSGNRRIYGCTSTTAQSAFADDCHAIDTALEDDESLGWRQIVIECEFMVSSSIIPKELHAHFLSRYFGTQYQRGEALVHEWATRLSGTQSTGSWDFFQLSNGGFYMAPASCGRIPVRWHMNGYSDMMGQDAFGVVVTLFSLRHLAEKCGNHGIIGHYHSLRTYATQHMEAANILRAID
jgi:hypothetical protein